MPVRFLIISLFLVVAQACSSNNASKKDGGGVAGPIVRIRAGESVQGAVDKAPAGATIEFEPGTHKANIVLTGKALTLRGKNPTDAKSVAATILDGGAKGSVISYTGTKADGASGSLLIEGLTIQVGYSTGNGGGINIENPPAGASITIRNVVLHDNGTDGDGGGIFLRGTAGAVIENVTLRNNFAKRNGGGFAQIDSQGTRFSKSKVERNAAAGTGGGIQVNNVLPNSGLPKGVRSWMEMLDTEIAENLAISSGGGIRIDEDDDVTITGTIDVHGNIAGGAGRFVSSSNPRIGEQTWVGTPNANGGAISISLDGAAFSFSGTLNASGNTASGNGGGVHIDQFGWGGQVFLIDDPSTPAPASWSLSGNIAADGGGMWLEAGCEFMDPAGGTIDILNSPRVRFSGNKPNDVTRGTATNPPDGGPPDGGPLDAAIKPDTGPVDAAIKPDGPTDAGGPVDAFTPESFAGVWRATLTVASDPGGHAATLAMPKALDLTVTSKGGRVSFKGASPFVHVGGNLFPSKLPDASTTWDSYNGTGSDPYKGFQVPRNYASISGRFTTRTTLSGTYTLTLDKYPPSPPNKPVIYTMTATKK